MNKKTECLCIKCDNYKKNLNTKFFCDNFSEIFEDVSSNDCLCEKCKYHSEKKYKFNLYCYNGTEDKLKEM
ncbi:MAG: hypothetical protein QME48_08665 [bacterium]|nr:hypothetical protein [bacterium]